MIFDIKYVDYETTQNRYKTMKNLKTDQTKLCLYVLIVEYLPIYGNLLFKVERLEVPHLSFYLSPRFIALFGY